MQSRYPKLRNHLSTLGLLVALTSCGEAPTTEVDSPPVDAVVSIRVAGFIEAAGIT